MSDFSVTQTDIDAIEAAGITVATDGFSEAEIDGRRVRKLNPEMLLRVARQLQADLDSEDDGGMIKPFFKATS